jgi:hypothetical protein
MDNPGFTLQGVVILRVSPSKVLTGGTDPGCASPIRSPRLRTSGQQTVTKWLRFTGR